MSSRGKNTEKNARALAVKTLKKARALAVKTLKLFAWTEHSGDAPSRNIFVFASRDVCDFTG
jgi:hypothetical protein